MQYKRNDYDTTKDILGIIREGKERLFEEDKKEAIPYANNDDLFQNIKQSTMNAFGASYPKGEVPMYYYPETDSIKLVGSVSGVGANLKFQYDTNEGVDTGCKIICDSLNLNKGTLETLYKIHGTFINWQGEITKNPDKEPMSYSRKDNNQGGMQLKPGDDKELL